MKLIIAFLLLIYSTFAYSARNNCLNTSHEYNYGQIGFMIRDNELDKALQSVEKEIGALTNQGCEHQGIKFHYAKAAILSHKGDYQGAEREVNKAIRKVRPLIDDHFYYLYFFKYMRFKSYVLRQLTKFELEHSNREQLHRMLFNRFGDSKVGPDYRIMLAQSHFDLISMNIRFKDCIVANEHLRSAKSLLSTSSSEALLSELAFLSYVTDLECNNMDASKDKVLQLYERWKASGQNDSYNYDHFSDLFEELMSRQIN